MYHLRGGSSEQTGTPPRTLRARPWGGPVAVSDPAHNFAFPDSAATYWFTRFQLPAGAKLLLHGRFAHARYQSFSAYSAANATPVDALNDVQTAPDSGSANPFLPGALRTAIRRSYTVTVTATAPPAQRAPNTLYAGVPGQDSQDSVVPGLRADQGRDPTGGIGLPDFEVHLADGQVLRGQAACDAIGASAGKPTVQTLPPATYAALRDRPASRRRSPLPTRRSSGRSTASASWSTVSISGSTAANHPRGRAVQQHRLQLSISVREPRVRPGPGCVRQAPDHPAHMQR